MASTSYKSDSTVWDAFLNFRGPDTRKGFISHLYTALNRAGIRTFLDDRELPIGGELSPELLKAIRESKVSIVVFSSNYASSSWCLEELVKILECRKKGQLVVPVFYNVNPLDVRHQKESFTRAFKNHEKYFAVDKLDMWRAAITEAANLKGHHHSASGDGLEANLIQEIVDKVLHKVNPMRLYVAKEPVGIESRVEKITQLLILGNNDVRMIGIYGMGGVGKTTIAKAVYNKIYVNFEGSCFLMNVREVSGYPNGLVGLQKELLSEVLKIKDILVSTVDGGISLIEERLRHKKVLIVLDDLYHLRQLDSLAGQWNRFAPGSRIIITTRDGRLLDQIQVDDRYQLGQMNKDEALELLSRHAFGKSIPDEDFMELSKHVLRFAGGVPLALEVFGSNLVNRTVIEWRSFIKKLQQSPHHEIQEKLIISFDALKDDNLQDIFLDIACFFNGVDKNEAISILNACDSCAENDIAILEKRCLLTIDGNNKLRMHDLLQDIGRGIVRNKSKTEGGMLSRLWSSGDISAVMKSSKGARSVEGIIPKDFNSWTRTLSTHTFERMNKLRLLQINYVHLYGSFEDIFQDLRWLCWNECPLKCLPCDFHPEKLVILDMQHSKVTTLWEHWEGIKFLQNLKTLNLSYSLFLTTTPDFTRVPVLERLLLQNCESLTNVHPSIGRLSRLVYLNLKNCYKLQNFLSNSVCYMRSLEELNLCCCYKLEHLPEQLGNMVCLRRLFASETAISKIPDSIGNLSRLGELDLNHCNNLINLPNNICSLRALETLNLHCCSNLEGLPEELGDMECLRVLDIRFTSLKKLPYSIGLMKSLRSLECSLKVFDTQTTFVPPSISGLCSLKELNLDFCGLLKIPDGIGSLFSLEMLSLSHNHFQSLPSGFSQLANLKTLKLRYCKKLASLSELPPNLEWFDASGCAEMYRLTSLSNLKDLKYLDLRNCSNLVEILGLEDLNFVQYVHLEGCTNLRTFKESFFKRNSEFGEIIIVLPCGKVPPLFEVSSFCFHVPNKLEDILGMAIWADCDGEYPRQITVAIKNITKNSEWTHKLSPPALKEFSFLIFIPKAFTIESRDKIMISFPLNFGAHLGTMSLGLKFQSVRSCGVRVVYKPTEDNRVTAMIQASPNNKVDIDGKFELEQGLIIFDAEDLSKFQSKLQREDTRSRQRKNYAINSKWIEDDDDEDEFRMDLTWGFDIFHNEDVNDLNCKWRDYEDELE